MLQSINKKVGIVLAPAIISDNASPTCTEVDTLGFDYCEIYVMFGAMDVAMVACSVSENNVSATSLAAVTGLVYGTSANIAGTTSTLPTAGSDNTILAFHIDLRSRMRFLNLVLTTGDGTAGTYLVAWYELSRAENVPVTAAEYGAAQVLRV
jgi:hypothetical protein